MKSRQVLLILLPVLTGALAGCGREWSAPELGQVRGKLTLDGRPLSDMMVIFEPEEGQQSVATSGDDGSFKAMYYVDLEGVQTGPCTVRIVPGIGSSIGFIHPKYGAESELTFDVAPGDNVFDIDLGAN